MHLYSKSADHYLQQTMHYLQKNAEPVIQLQQVSGYMSPSSTVQLQTSAS